MSFTFERVGEFCVATRECQTPVTQGQVFKIDGRYMAAAGWKNGRVSFVTKVGSWLDGFDQPSYEFQGPFGSGFSNFDAQKAFVVVGGTGVGAGLHLLAARDPSLETHLLFYSRDKPCYEQLASLVGLTSAPTTVTQWNTKKKGRPQAPLDLLHPIFCGTSDFSDTHFFAVGPKSLVDAVRKQCKELGVPDENFHLNY